jgi:hypothetical protein
MSLESPRPRPQGEPPGWNGGTERLLRDWHNRVAAAQDAHYELVTRLRRHNVLLGVPAVVFSAVVGTSLFATLNEAEISTILRLIIGSLSVAAAVLAALQTFLRFAERAEKHQLAADWYSAIRRDIQELQTLPPGSRGDPKAVFDRLRKEINRVVQQSPEIGQNFWAEVATNYGVRVQRGRRNSRSRESPGLPRDSD